MANYADHPVPVSWEFLQSYKEDPFRYKGVPRKYAVELRYIERMKDKQRDNAVELSHRFGFDRKDPIIPWTIIDNEFPYDVQPDIRHMVMFVNPKAEDYVRERIDIILFVKARSMGYTEYLYFEQPQERRSLPDITHFHVFLRCTARKRDGML